MTTLEPPEPPEPSDVPKPPAYGPPPGYGPPAGPPPPDYGPPAAPPPDYGPPAAPPPDYGPPAAAPPPGYGPPPGYPPPGYGAPMAAGYGSGDALVPAPAGGFGAWWQRLWAVFGRDWRGLVPIVLLTYSLPSVLYAIIGGWNSRTTRVSSNGVVSVTWRASGGWIFISILFVLVAAVLGAIGFAAATRYVTRRSVGATESLGDALRYGASRAGRLAPLFILVALMVLVGLFFCVLPGLYLGVATSFVGPILLYEGGPGVIGRSFRTVNAHFGAVLGRLAMLFVLLAVLGVVVGCLAALLTGGGRAGSVISGIVVAVLEAPLTALLVLGVVLTYAQVRARTAPIDAAGLDAALGSAR